VTAHPIPVDKSSYHQEVSADVRRFAPVPHVHVPARQMDVLTPKPLKVAQREIHPGNAWALQSRALSNCAVNCSLTPRWITSQHAQKIRDLS
jgi:hypothetical protein